MERRRTIRLMTEKGLIALGRRTGELVGAGWPLRDISEGGLRFAIPKDMPNPPQSGDEVSVTVELATDAAGGDALVLNAVVRRMHKGETDDEQEVSLEFTDLTPHVKSEIRGTVLDLAVAKIASGKDTLAGKTISARSARSASGARGARLGDILVTRDSITRVELEKFVAEDYEKGAPLGRQLVGRGIVEEAEVARALAEQSDLQYVDLDVEGIDLLKIRQFGEAYLTQHVFVPLSIDQTYVSLAAASPLSSEVTTNVEKQYNRKARMLIASERQIVSAIQKAFYISRNRRRSARFSTGLSVRYKFYGSDWKPIHEEILAGLTKNISEGGLLFLGPAPAGVKSFPPQDTRLNVGVHLFLPNQKEPVRAPCELVRVTMLRAEQPREGALCLYGAKVLGISDADRKRVNLYRMQASVPRLFQDRYA
jgi:c-di-GMP-binding flagellar brake protein YcgR